MNSSNWKAPEWLSGLDDWYEETPFNQWGRDVMDDVVYPMMENAQPGDLNSMLEAGKQMGAGALNTIGAGYEGLLALPAGLDVAADRVRMRTDPSNPGGYNPLMSYEAQGDGAQAILQGAETLARPLAAAGPMLGNLAMEATGNPELATAAHVAPDAALGALGLRSVANARVGMPKGKQLGINDLYGPDRLPPPAAKPWQDRAFEAIFPENPEGVTGRRDPGRYQEGSVKITRPADADGVEGYAPLEDVAKPLKPFYRSPPIDESNANFSTIPNRPPSTGGDEIFTSSISEALRYTNRKSGTKEQWIKAFEKNSVDRRELGFAGIMAALPDKGEVSRQEIVDAYNNRNASLDLWATGTEVGQAASPELLQAVDDAREAKTTAFDEGKVVVSEVGKETYPVPQIDMARSYYNAIAGNDKPRADLMKLELEAKGLSPASFERLEEAALRDARARQDFADIEQQYRSMGDKPYGKKSYLMSEYQIGGGLSNIRLAWQQPRNLYDEYGKDIPVHYGDLNSEDMVNLMHGRFSINPVMSEPIMDIDGEPHRATTLFRHEGQSDPSQRFKPGTTGSWGGLRSSRKGLDGDVGRLKDEVNKIEAYEALLRNHWDNYRDQNFDGESPERIYYLWNSRVDSELKDIANRYGVPDGRIHPLSAGEMRDHLRAKIADGTFPFSGDDGAKVKQLLDEYAPVEGLIKQLVQSQEAKKARKSQLDSLGGGAYLHEDMPFIHNDELGMSSGRREQQNAQYYAQLAAAIDRGDEFISVTTHRGFGESYDYGVGKPEKEALQRWGSGGSGADMHIVYDPQDDMFYDMNNTDRWGEPESVDADDLPEEVINDAQMDAPDYYEWRDSAAAAWVDEQVQEAMDGLEERSGWLDEDRDDTWSTEEEASEWNVKQYEKNNDKPERGDFESEDDYDEAVDEWTEGLEAAKSDVEEVQGYFDGNDNSIIFDTIEEAQDHYQDSFEEMVGYETDSDIGNALGTHWEEEWRGVDATLLPASGSTVGAVDVPYDTPMGPIEDSPIEDWQKPKPRRNEYGTESGYISAMESWQADPWRVKDNTKNTWGAAETYYKDSITKANMIRFLRGLGLTTSEMEAAMTTTEIAVGGGKSPAGRNLKPGRKTRVRSIRITDAVKDAFENRRPGGLFGRMPMPDRSARDARAMANQMAAERAAARATAIEIERGIREKMFTQQVRERATVRRMDDEE